MEKPALGLTTGPYTNVHGWNASIPGGDSNILLLDDVNGKAKWGQYWDGLMTLDGSTFWLDHEPSSRRYRQSLFAFHALAPGTTVVALWSSGDRIRWEMVKNQSSAIEDRSTFFYNPFRRKWVFSKKNICAVCDIDFIMSPPTFSMDLSGMTITQLR